MLSGNTIGAWVLPERERLQQMFLSAGVELAGIHLNSAHNELAVEVCHRLIREDGCFEEAYCLAMQAYAAMRNQAAASRLYDSLREALSAELGVCPSAQTEALFQALVH
jgi:DNA-binding SARP family transcriptional activator